MTKYLTLIFKNLLRTKRRTILTILSIAISLFIFSVLVSLPTFANQMLADTTSSVRILCRTKMGLGYPLPVAYKSKIATIPHVVAVAPLVIYGGIYHEASDQFPSVATEAKEIDMWSDWGLTAVNEFKRSKPRAWWRKAQCAASISMLVSTSNSGEPSIHSMSR